MYLLSNISKEEAINAFAEYCSQSSTPADIFNFDGDIPTIKIKYSPLMTYYAKYNYSALVEITTESQYHTTSSLEYNTSQYKSNIKNSNSGFFESMYEDYADTRYDDTTVKNVYMDRTNGVGDFVVFGAAGTFGTVEECLWPDESVDSSMIVDDLKDYRISGNEDLFAAAIKATSCLNTDNSPVPENKMEYFINNNIENDIKKRYENCSYEIKTAEYALINASISIDVLFFPYYEIEFYHNGILYTIQIAAHNQAKKSTGFFGQAKNVVTGNLPSFIKQPTGLFGKIKNYKDRKDQKKSDKDNFLNNIVPKMDLSV